MRTCQAFSLAGCLRTTSGSYGGAKVTHEPVELGLAHPVGIVRMRIQFV
ncbi:MAG: hypothetical protein ACYTE1_07075 [Planctomycetota bacterium]